jgi:hypothetical protein
MIRFLRSPLLAAVITCLLLISVFVLVRYHDATLRHGSFTSGYFLIGLVFFLAAFNIRKKLSFLPLGSAVVWMRLHVFLGVAAMAIFTLHVGIRWPNGIFESLLFTLFVLVSASGMYGLYLTKTVPKKLSKLREEIIFERIPFFRSMVRNQAHDLVVALVSKTPADTLADFYTSELTSYFVKPRGLWYNLRPTSGMRNQLRNRLQDLQRYCSPEEKEVTERLERLIDSRDDLDYHAAMQGKLKLWLFGHIGLTCALVIAGVIHAIMAHAFRGGGVL